MCIVTQWLRKRHAQRQIFAERKVEAEKQAQHEEEAEGREQVQGKRQDFGHRRALQLSLQGLQDVMDPLIASQAYNARFCPLTRLPEEVLLNVLDFLRGDDVTLYCLRWTSRTFLRLLHQQSGFWSIHTRVYSPFSLESNKILQLRRLSEKDGRCENCRRWNARQRYSIEPCKFEGSYSREKPIFSGCEYWWIDYRRPYCSACDTDHDACQFPMAYRTLPQHQETDHQICLGQRGSVKLCEHVYISWDTVKAHIDAWRRQPEGAASARDDWKACLESFSIECHNSAHDIRCADSEAPSWPRARLGTGGYYCENDVVLYLEWTPHGRVDSLKPTSRGQIPAAELRALFRKFRRLGPADSFYPRGFPDHLPEMACFKHDFPIYYNTGEEQPSQSSSVPSAPFNQRQLAYRCQRVGNSLPGRNSRALDVSPHFVSGTSCQGIASQCLAVRYQKGIMICQITAVTDPAIKLVPSDPWLHAMDTQTYPQQQAKQFRPQCRDASCTNYYQREKSHGACSRRE